MTRKSFAGLPTSAYGRPSSSNRQHSDIDDCLDDVGRLLALSLLLVTYARLDY